MMLVFIPVSFMPGTAGVFYQQFGLTMAIAIGFSAVNALTLSPALCAVFLKAKDDDSSLKERMGKAYEATGEVLKKYARSFGLNFPPIITFVLLCATITFMVLDWYAFENVVESIIACVVALLAVLGLFGERFHRAFENSYGKLLGIYRKCVNWMCAHRITSFATVLVAVLVLVWLMIRTPSAMVPDEDTGFFFGMVDMPRAHLRNVPPRCSTNSKR